RSIKTQTRVVRREIIIALGKFAVQTLLQSKVPITKVRGNWYSYHGIKLMPTFHPAYLLRNPGDKKLVWEDIKKVIKEMKGENAQNHTLHDFLGGGLLGAGATEGCVSATR